MKGLCVAYFKFRTNLPWVPFVSMLTKNRLNVNLTIILVNPNRRFDMKTLSLSEVKMKLSALLDALAVTDEEVVITKNGRPAGVLVSPDEFESWHETLAIRSDKDLMDEIKKGLNALKKKDTSLYTLDELFG